VQGNVQVQVLEIVLAYASKSNVGIHGSVLAISQCLTIITAPRSGTFPVPGPCRPQAKALY